MFWLLIICTIIGAAIPQDLPPELQGDPCSQENSILWLSSNKCLVLVQQSLGWIDAQAKCEQAGGWLYMMPSARLYSRPHLMDCLSSMERAGYSDLWLNGISLWSPQFLWTNRSFVNKVTYCPKAKPPTEKAAITSDFLSVDYCVSTCHDQGDRFTVLYATGSSPKCNCISDLDSKYMVPCATTNFNYGDSSRYYIVHSEENSLIKVGSADTFSSTEIMCATVDVATVKDRELKSDTCFTERPFLCELGTAKECIEAEAKLACIGTECLFTCGNKCLKRMSYPYNWYAAQSYCSSLGGNLWSMNDLDDMSQVAQYLDVDSRYWIGASNYVWNFNASRGIGASLANFVGKYRCGHMFRETTRGSGNRSWKWSDADCGQQKAYLCEFGSDRSASSDDNVTCPWNITYIDGGAGTAAGVSPGVIPGGGGITEDKVTAGDDDSFPVAALIAGIIAGLILLTCLGLAFAFCGRRHWKKVKEHLTFIPYFNDTSHVMMGHGHDFESMSQVGHSRSHMSSVSEHGSQIGLMKGGYSSYGMTSAALAASNGMFSSKSLDRRHIDSMGQNYMSSANNSMDERGFAASYSTMPSKQKEYMTLQAQMNIQDDAQLEAMRGSLRRKPEMTLVTDNVDMNLTVNHASSSHALVTGNALTNGNALATGSGSATERVMEEVTLPASVGGAILTFPEPAAGGASESEVILTFPERSAAASSQSEVILTYPEPPMVSSQREVIMTYPEHQTASSSDREVILTYAEPRTALVSDGGMIMKLPERVPESHMYTTSTMQHQI